MIGLTQVNLVSDKSPLVLLADIKEALAQRSQQKIRANFLSLHGADYLFSMAANRGERGKVETGLAKLKFAIIPAPPGWPGHYWATFHTVQTIEEDHDPVYQVVQDSNFHWKIGAEIPEDELHGWRIAGQSYHAVVLPAASRVDVQVDVALVKGSRIAVPFRLNDNYRLQRNVVTATEDEIPNPKEGEIVRAGSLLIPWTRNLGDHLQLSYSAVLPKGDEDEITGNDAYVTAWWLPSLGRLPFTVDSTIVAPSGWKVRAEGMQTSQRQAGSEQIDKFTCNLPISYPKIVAGKYVEVAVGEQNGDRFAIYQFAPVEKRRAERDLKKMMEAAAFYRKVLGPLPFKGYECYDAERYYGIESYSHTLLQKGVTHFISHEMGHTYFGGLAPCPYVNDSWNEGLTEYIDSVVLLHDEDRSLENGLQTVNIPVPLSQMPIPWNLGDATYWRGCYVMKMLEAEIGPDKVLQALRLIVSERVGKDTRWADLRQYFEVVSHRSLKWYWQQWVDNASFPTLHYTAESFKMANGVWDNTIKVDQEGVEHPFKIRAAIKLAGTDKSGSQPISFSDWTTTLHFQTKSEPSHVELEVFPYTLARLKRTASSPK